MIHSSPERNIPDWNESFQTGITYTDVVEKNPYWCYSEMLTFLGSGRGVRAIPVGACCQAQVQVQVPGQVPGQVLKVQGLRTKDLDLGLTLNLVCNHHLSPPTKLFLGSEIITETITV